nr:hypothetical protein BaRGS_014942 [Batillaria attramentaria]
MKPSTNWQTAQNVCQSEGGHLFRMKTAAKKTYFGLLRTTLGWPQPELWVDATYVAADGNYVWGDGDPVDHSLFQSGFPGNKDCVKVTWDLQLQDTECTSSLEYVSGGIPSDYTVMADGVTHIKVHKENPLKPWTEAQDICNSEGAHLVRMKTTTKKNNLNQALSDMGAAGQEYWVDSTFTEGENIYRWGDGDPGKIKKGLRT